MRHIFAVLFHSSMISILRYNAPRGISFTFAVNWTSAFPAEFAWLEQHANSIEKWHLRINACQIKNESFPSFF